MIVDCADDDRTGLEAPVLSASATLSTNVAANLFLDLLRLLYLRSFDRSFVCRPANIIVPGFAGHQEYHMTSIWPASAPHNVFSRSRLRSGQFQFRNRLPVNLVRTVGKAQAPSAGPGCGEAQIP